MLLRIFETGLQERQVLHLVHCIQNGGIMIYPTDTIYGIGTALSNIHSLDRVAAVVNKRKDEMNFTLLCRDLSHLARFAQPISNSMYRVIKGLVPGPYTFILNANHEVPKLFQSPKKQIGIRVPNHPVLQSILEVMDEPLLNISLPVDENAEPENFTDPTLIHDRLGRQVDLVIDGGIGKIQYSTILDCTQDEISVVRQGIGPFEV
ncbi:MAG: threonylcarbamoyl-AMP synthase [Bacteroidales bacterium]|nr:threonylcarbamoyl-AMP synthase [Bacteroidales bacterium]MDE7102993.1 threonylcarbamoyl-AMP synthase [Bacteroidales bacterium]